MPDAVEGVATACLSGGVQVYYLLEGLDRAASDLGEVLHDFAKSAARRLLVSLRYGVRLYPAVRRYARTLCITPRVEYCRKHLGINSPIERKECKVQGAHSFACPRPSDNSWQHVRPLPLQSMTASVAAGSSGQTRSCRHCLSCPTRFGW